jgi:ubiquinone biosynthesis UbiH/UbiF/VisC/COQ6 family hydroxylase
VSTVEYHQLGVVANFEAARPHRGVAYQWFTGDTVLALLPLPHRRLSMVWSAPDVRARELLGMPEAALCAEVERASGGVLGSLELITPAAAFPLKRQRVEHLVEPRAALVGDAAHNIHPLAGQGVNLGLRDARELCEVLADRGPQRDCGDYGLLRRYERARREDIATLELTTDGLEKLFHTPAVWLAGLRNFGLTLVDAQGPLKTALARRAAA